jgi:hypothetical protein
MTSELTLTVMINVVFQNHVVPGERREMFFFKDVPDLNSAVLMPNTKRIQLNINAHKELRNSPRPNQRSHKSQHQLAQVAHQYHQVTQQQLVQMLREELHYSI